jgi:hypothetical protein
LITQLKFGLRGLLNARFGKGRLGKHTSGVDGEEKERETGRIVEIYILEGAHDLSANVLRRASLTGIQSIRSDEATIEPGGR